MWLDHSLQRLLTPMLLINQNGKHKLVTNQVTYPARIRSAPGLKKLDKIVMLDTAEAQETLLEVNNVEVIYNHVILVLKGCLLYTSPSPRD